MTLKIGDCFRSHNDFENAFKIYKDTNFVDFYISDSRTLNQALTKCPYKVNSVASKEDMKYYYVKYRCILGGTYKKRKDCKMERKTKTYRQGCPAFISLGLSEDSKSLKIKNMNDTHNHETSPEIYNSFAKVRILSPTYKKIVMDYVNLKADKKLIQNKIRKETGKLVTMRDIKNIITRDRQKAKLSEKMPQTNWNVSLDLKAISSVNPNKDSNLMEQSQPEANDPIVDTSEKKSTPELSPEMEQSQPVANDPIVDTSERKLTPELPLGKKVLVLISSEMKLKPELSPVKQSLVANNVTSEKSTPDLLPEKLGNNDSGKNKLECVQQQLCSLSRSADKDELFGAYVGQALQDIKNERSKELCRLEIQQTLFRYKFEDS